MKHTVSNILETFKMAAESRPHQILRDLLLLTCQHLRSTHLDQNLQGAAGYSQLVARSGDYSGPFVTF